MSTRAHKRHTIEHQIARQPYVRRHCSHQLNGFQVAVQIASLNQSLPCKCDAHSAFCEIVFPSKPSSLLCRLSLHASSRPCVKFDRYSCSHTVGLPPDFDMRECYQEEYADVPATTQDVLSELPSRCARLWAACATHSWESRSRKTLQLICLPALRVGLRVALAPHGVYGSRHRTN